MKRLAIVTAALLATALALAPAAQAAKPCGTEKVTPRSFRARVAVVDVSCKTGLQVAYDLYALLAEGAKPDSNYRYHVDGFGCFTGLGSSELSCRHRHSWVFASTRPEDHPGQWHVPHPRRPRPRRPLLGTSEPLSKASARLAAELAAGQFSSRKTWSTNSQIGACRRLSTTRFKCQGRISGDQFKDCDFEEALTCSYVFHSCSFEVAVHKAGYSALGRIHEVSCTAEPHTG